MHSQPILIESCTGNAAKEAMFFCGIRIAICVTLTNLNPDLTGVNTRMHARMIAMYESCMNVNYLL
jgi:hypothetical protein